MRKMSNNKDSNNQDYKEISYFKYLFGLDLSKDENNVLFILLLILITLALLITIKFIVIKSTFVCILFFVLSLLFFYMLFKVFSFTLLYVSQIEIHLNQRGDNTILFNQKFILNKFLEKNEKSGISLFLITFLKDKDKIKRGKKINKEKIAVYFILKKYIEYLIQYKSHKYVIYYASVAFIITSLIFFNLLVFLNNVDINDSNRNIIFFFSLLYILITIIASYLPFLESFRKRFIGYHIYKYTINDILIDDNLDKKKEDENRIGDVLAIVFGVLFSLYVTMAFNTVYNVNVDIKKISIVEEAYNGK